MSSKITKALKFANDLLEMGVPYRWWTPKGKHEIYPLYAVKSFDEISIDMIKKEGINCAGFINLLRLHVGLSIPGLVIKDGKVIKGPKHTLEIENTTSKTTNNTCCAPNAGGTRTWFNYLDKQGRLEPFDITKRYPKGTLLIRNYTTMNDQGHVAVLTTDNAPHPWENWLIHAVAETYGLKKLPEKPVPFGVFKTMLAVSHYLSGDPYYTHACLPENWLNKD
jgi:hypothetical protein